MPVDIVVPDDKDLQVWLKEMAEAVSPFIEATNRLPHNSAGACLSPLNQPYKPIGLTVECWLKLRKVVVGHTYPAHLRGKDS